MSKLSIKKWAKEDRPREKLMLKGASILSDSELLAILIGSGNDKESAVELSKRILIDMNNDLNRLGRLGATDLMHRYKGIGPAKAVTVIAALELGRRRKLAKAKESNKIHSSRDVFNHFYPKLCDLNHEESWVLLTDRANHVLDLVQVGRGGISATTVDIRLILREALKHYASGIFLAHNHPSGTCDASSEDMRITYKLKDAAQYMDIRLLDHIIVCGNSYYSFTDEGIL